MRQPWPTTTIQGRKRHYFTPYYYPNMFYQPPFHYYPFISPSFSSLTTSLHSSKLLLTLLLFHSIPFSLSQYQIKQSTAITPTSQTESLSNFVSYHIHNLLRHIVNQYVTTHHPTIGIGIVLTNLRKLAGIRQRLVAMSDFFKHISSDSSPRSRPTTINSLAVPRWKLALVLCVFLLVVPMVRSHISRISMSHSQYKKIFF